MIDRRYCNECKAWYYEDEWITSSLYNLPRCPMCGKILWKEETVENGVNEGWLI